PLPARDLTRPQQEIAKAKARFDLPADAPVCTCYEAGRDGFWLHRALTSQGINNVVVDSGAIEVNRRRKQAKTDPIDAAKLVNLLCRYHGGERKVFSVVNVPTAQDEVRQPGGKITVVRFNSYGPRIPVADLRRTIEFYTQTLGFCEMPRWP